MRRRTDSPWRIREAYRIEMDVSFTQNSSVEGDSVQCPRSQASAERGDTSWIQSNARHASVSARAVRLTRYAIRSFHLGEDLRRGLELATFGAGDAFVDGSDRFQ